MGIVRRRYVSTFQSLTSWQTWQRPTLPRLETKYHRRWGVSRPSSEWDRVQPPRHSHQVSEEVNDFWSVLSLRLRMPTWHPAHALSDGSHIWDHPVLCCKGEHCLMRATKPIELLVPVSYTPCSASTPGLSTWWSSTALKGELVLRWVSRLDAFSDYPVRT